MKIHLNYRELSLVALLLLAALVTTACRSSTNMRMPVPGIFWVTSTDEGGRVHAPAGTVDPITTVRIAAGGVGEGRSAPDGSVTFDASFSGPRVSIEHQRSGATLVAEVDVVPLASMITKPLFSTGAGPNSMIRGYDGLLIANSLDNTVTHHSSNGEVLATATFPQFAGPAFLAVHGDRVFVARNGDNVVSVHNLALEPIEGLSFQLADPGTAFIGPGQLATDGRFIFVPRAQLTSFAPTAYGGGLLSTFDAAGEHAERTTALSGRNAVFALFTGLGGFQRRLFVVSAGELHFDERFAPYIATDSFVDAFDVDLSGNLTKVGSINLGPVGASKLVHAGSGATGYLASLVSGSIFKVDLQTLAVLRGQQDPIRLTERFTYISDMAAGAGSLLLATSFNTDELFVVDMATDTVSPGSYLAPFDLSIDPNLLAGPQAVVIEQYNPPHAAVLYGLANSVAQVRLFISRIEPSSIDAD